jgi:hypothetical protein
MRFVPLDEFVSVDEPGADALLGDADNVLIPQGGDVMIYGDGGAGKTTLGVDLAFHLAAGDDWCGIPIPHPVNVGIIENEGPRALFRQKLRRKRESWAGSPLDGRLHVLDLPWAHFTFSDDDHRAWLASAVAELELDLGFVGPLTRLGMNESGTLQDTRDFSALVADVRVRADRPVTFAIVHHENKGGQVSGAWEGAGDTLLHVQAQGHGRTRLVVQKARWASSWHGKGLQLVWADGESFTVGGDSGPDNNTIADEILKAARATGGQTWNAIEKTIGGNAARAREIRDDLLAGGRLVNDNAGKSKTMLLWDAEDPLRPLRLDPDAPADAHGGEGNGSVGASLRPPYRDAGRSDAPAPPAGRANDQTRSSEPSSSNEVVW